MGITPTPTKRDYFFDGNIGVYQSADLAATHIFVSMRRGGRAIYAFDVSNPDSPRFLWKKDYQDADTRFAELGYTWSEPKVIAIRRTAGTVCRTSDPTTFTRALVFGAGYDPTEEDKDAGVLRTPTMGRGVFVLNAETGAVIKLLQSTGADKKYSFPADVTLLDSNADGCIDRLYAVDTGANIHRFDIDDVLPANWKTYKIASLGDVENNGGSNDRKFLYPVDAVMGTVNGAPVTYLVAGSGNREIPRDQVIDNRFFMVKDTIAAGTDPSTLTGYPVVAGDLMPVTIFDGATTNIDATASSFRGWYLTLETGEKVVNAPLTVAGITYFGTNTPKQASAQCTPNLGTARGYQVSYLNGTARGDLNGDGVIDGNDVHTDFTGGGLPPSPVTGVVKIDNKFVRFMIGGGCGAEGSAIEGCKVEAFPSSTRTRVYWYFKKDN
jgi:type IV pilus assembly protein PilY1